MEKIKILYNKYKQTRIFSAGVMLIVTVAICFVINQNMVTYQVTDGFTTKTLKTFVSNNEQIIQSAGYSLDEYALEKVTESDKQNILYIKPLFDVNVTYDKTVASFKTIEKPVLQILQDNNIVLNEFDEVIPSKETILKEATDITIKRITKTTEKIKSPVKFKKTIESTSKLNLGETKVITSGVDGEKLDTLEITFTDGKETNRKVIGSEIIKHPVNEVTLKGTQGVIDTKTGESLKYKKSLVVEASAYSTEGWKSKHTASGTLARVGAIAVDPKVIPLGSKLYVTSPNGKSWVYGHAVAEDTGGAIKGNKIDLFFNTQKECINFGRQKAIVYILD